MLKFDYDSFFEEIKKELFGYYRWEKGLKESYSNL